MDVRESIQIAKDHGFGFDHEEHDVLFDAAKSIKGIEGIVCEVGLRAGGGLINSMLACISNNDINRPFISIDPYGNISYELKQNMFVKLDYTNEMKNKTLSSMYLFCYKNQLYYDHYNLTDADFFKYYSEGIIVYREESKVYNKYALVHLDGPHSKDPIITEIDFFRNKISQGGFIVLDDVVGYYDVESVHLHLTKYGDFNLVHNDGKKASYKKIN